MIRKWQERKDIDIEYIHQQNKGVSVARNNGIEHCETLDVLFCDADDMMPNYSIEMVRKLISKCDIVAGLASRNAGKMNSRNNNYIESWGGKL